MIRSTKKSDTLQIASLHHRTLTNSFLATLGIGFLESLYEFLITKELVIVYDEENVITGFVSFSFNTSGMMMRFLFTCPVCIFRLKGILINSPIIFKRIIETFAAPFKSKSSQTSTGKVILPNAELLSISVDPYCQQTGIGRQLINALEQQLIKNGIRQYKVIADVSLDGANKFYLRNGFVLVSQVIIHGNELSNIYLKDI